METRSWSRAADHYFGKGAECGISLTATERNIRNTKRYQPEAVCVELKSLKIYCQSFRNEGIFYEAVTNRIRDDLAEAMSPRWLQVITNWRGRGGIRSRITAEHGEVPLRFTALHGDSTAGV